MDSILSWSIVPSVPWITAVFIACIVGLWAYFFFFRFTPVIVANAPAVLTSLGIFATFVGVAWGLSGFDTGDIQGSIPALLDGLKHAFWSSIAGIGGAVLIKLKHLISTRRADKDEAAHRSATIDDLADLLRELNRSLKGDAQPTVLLNDRLDALQRSLDQYLANVVESNSRALVDALREVLRDFNATLNEEFGENFKRLDEMIKQQADAAEGMSATSRSYQALVETAEAFSGIAARLGELLSNLERQREQAQEATASLVDIGDFCRTWNFITPTAHSPAVHQSRHDAWQRD